MEPPKILVKNGNKFIVLTLNSYKTINQNGIERKHEF